MAEIGKEILAWAMLIGGLLTVTVWPILCFFELHYLRRRLDRIEVELVDGPQPPDEHPVPHKSADVIAIGKRAA